MAMAMAMASKTNLWLCFLLVVTLSSLFISSSSTFRSDELVVDDEEFGLEGLTATVSPDLDYINPSIQSPQSTIKKRSSSSHHDSADSKVQFSLDHAFGLAHSHFSPAGTFTARLKTWNHGGQTLTKLRFSREDFTDSDKEKFERLLKDDDFYRIRLPSNVLSPPGKDYILSAVRARCLAGDSLDEHFVIHMEGVNVVGVNYGSPGACQYPRPLRLPKKWSFNSYTVLKSSEQAPRAPAFTEDIIGGENGEEGVVPPPERSFWAKYWMYLIPLGLIVMNAVTQAMNLPEETAAGQAASQPQQTTVQRAPSSAVRRR